MLSLCILYCFLHFQGGNILKNEVTFTKSKLGLSLLGKMQENRIEEVPEAFGADKTIESSYDKSSDRKSE